MTVSVTLEQLALTAATADCGSRGRASYAAATRALRSRLADSPDVDDAHPDAVLDPARRVQVAAITWQQKGCNELAAAGDMSVRTRRINGADNGLAERTACCRSAGEIWC